MSINNNLNTINVINTIKIKDFKTMYSNFLDKSLRDETEIINLNHIYDFTYQALNSAYKISKDEIINSISKFGYIESVEDKNINILNKGQVLSKNMMFTINYTYKLAIAGYDISQNEIIIIKNMLKYGTNFKKENITSENIGFTNKKQLHELIKVLNCLNNKINLNNSNSMTLKNLSDLIVLTLLPSIKRLKDIIKCNNNLNFLVNYWLLKNKLPIINLFDSHDANTLEILIFDAYKKCELFTTSTSTNCFKDTFDFNLMTQKDVINNWYLKRGSYDLDYLTINDFYGDDNFGKGFTKEFKMALSNKTNHSDWIYGQEIPIVPENPERLFENRELVDFKGYLDTINYKPDKNSFIYEISFTNTTDYDFNKKYRTLVESLILLFRTKEMSIRYWELSQKDDSGLQVATLVIVSDSLCPNEYSFSFQSFKRKFPVATNIKVVKIQE